MCIRDRYLYCIYVDHFPARTPWLFTTGSLPRIEGVHHRRARGKGRPFTGVSTAHDVPPGELVLHLAWSFLTSTDIAIVCSAAPAIAAYARLRHYAVSADHSIWSKLRSMGPVASLRSTISGRRSYTLAAMLLLLDFNVGDLIRWLGGVYTHDHIPHGSHSPCRSGN